MAAAILTAAILCSSPASAATVQPPAIWLITSSGRELGKMVEACWPADGAVLCQDTFSIYVRPAKYVAAHVGERVRFKIDYTKRPTSVRGQIFRPPVSAFGSASPLGEFDPADSLTLTWRVRLKPGRYVITLHAAWVAKKRSDSTSSVVAFGVIVLPASLPKTGVGWGRVGPLLLALAAVAAAILRSRSTRASLRSQIV